MANITSISLDPETARLAQRMKREGKNFSKFVRECLHLYYREDNGGEHYGEKVEWFDCEPFCWPTRKHFCRVCWPTGTPAIEDLRSARAQVEILEGLRSKGPSFKFDKAHLIAGLWSNNGQGRIEVELEPAVLEWLRTAALEHNRFIMPLADLDLVGNKKPVKAEKPRKGIIRRILTELGR
mgnify:CR=1 FL=1|tara:strand:- start:642 stop:1184 length:543 start_codon:yes stop_codon:yes gene_type:complete